MSSAGCAPPGAMARSNCATASLGVAEREIQAAAQRRQRAVVVVVHAAGLAQRDLGAIAPASRPASSALRSICTPHMRICERPVPTRSPMLSWMRSASVARDQRFVEAARGLEDRGAPVERGREADLRLLLAEERDGFIDQRQRLRVVAHAELRHRQAARGHHGFFAARMPPQQRVGAQQIVERLVGIAVAEIEPAAIAQHAAERERPVANRIDDARELDRGGVDAADIGADQRAHGAHAHGEVGHVAGGQQREARVGVRDALAAEAELARGVRGDGMQRRAARGRHVGGRSRSYWRAVAAPSPDRGRRVSRARRGRRSGCRHRPHERRARRNKRQCRQADDAPTNRARITGITRVVYARAPAVAPFSSPLRAVVQLERNRIEAERRPAVPLMVTRTRRVLAVPALRVMAYCWRSVSA